MRKFVSLLVRRQDLSYEEFASYYLNEHAPLAESLPGVRKYVTSLPANVEKAEYDGMTELHIEDGVSLSEIFGSDVGQRLEADTENFLDTDHSEMLVLESSVQFDRER